MLDEEFDFPQSRPNFCTLTRAKSFALRDVLKEVFAVETFEGWILNFIVMNFTTAPLETWTLCGEFYEDKAILWKSVTQAATCAAQMGLSQIRVVPWFPLESPEPRPNFVGLARFNDFRPTYCEFSPVSISPEILVYKRMQGTIDDYISRFQNFPDDVVDLCRKRGMATAWVDLSNWPSDCDLRPDWPLDFDDLTL